MEPLNAFIKANHDKLQKFFAYIVLTNVEPQKPKISDRQLEGAAELAHFQVLNVEDKVFTNLRIFLHINPT